MTTTENAWDTKHYHLNKLGAYDLTPASFLIDKVPFFKSQGVKRVLDAGCGQGRNCAYLLDQEFQIYGVDSSSSALLLCERLMDSKCRLSRDLSQPSRYHLYNRRLEELDHIFAPDSLDAVVSVTVLTHILDAEKVINQFYRALKPEGYVLADFANPKDSTYKYVSKGERIGDNAFLEEGTTVVYRNKREVKSLFPRDKWEILELNRIRFTEPPHPGSRPFEHQHCSYVILARKK